MSAPTTSAGPWIERRHLILLVLITALGAALRFYRLDAQSAWFDETFSIVYSSRDLRELFTILINDFFHPPLHYLVLHYWFELAGYGAWEARVISAALGTISIPLLYLITRRFFDSATGLCAALLLAISQLAIYYSQEARPYAPLQFVSLVAILAFLAFVEKPSVIRTACFVLAGLVLIYTHYYGAATLVALGLYWIIFRRQYPKQVLPRLAVAGILIAAAILPWVVAVRRNAIIQMSPTATTGMLLAPIEIVHEFNNTTFVTADRSVRPYQKLLGMILLGLPGVGAIWCGRRQRNGVVFALLMTVVPFVVATSSILFERPIVDRYVLFAAAGYYMLVALGWRACLPGPVARAAWLCVVVAVAGFALRANYTVATKPDYRAGFASMARQYQTGDCVANRPVIFRSRVHLAWEVYHPSLPLRLVDLTSTPAPPAGCNRLWLVWDKTIWMNGDKAQEAVDEASYQRLRETYSSAARYQHPALDIELFRRRP